MKLTIVVLHVHVGASSDVRDAVGMCAFEYIRDYEEWIHSGHFSLDVVNRLRGTCTYTTYHTCTCIYTCTCV